MVTITTKYNALPPNRSEGRTASPRFAGVASSTTQGIREIFEPQAQVQGKRLADILAKPFSLGVFQGDARKWGLSLEDMAGRFQTLLGVYLLQGYYSIKDDKHPWETNGRNAMIWVMTLLLQQMAKSENFGVNTLLFNPLMKQKGAHSSDIGLVQKSLDALRMDKDYLDILQDAGVSITPEELDAARKGKKALWASSWLDANKTALIKKRYDALHAKVVTPGEKALSLNKLTPYERKIYEAIPGFFRRINGWNGLSTAIIMGATIYFIGGVAMRIVNKVISPLDKDFDGNKNRQPGQPPKPALFAKGKPPQNPAHSLFPATYSSNSSDNSSIQLFQSYVSQRRNSNPRPSGGSYS